MHESVMELQKKVKMVMHIWPVFRVKFYPRLFSLITSKRHGQQMIIKED